jgi:pimeloyl-ACP methyl ester carboxylesterase
VNLLQLYLNRIEATRPQRPVGALSQMCAALTHRVSAARLRQLSATVPKVLIITGDQDHLVAPHKSRYIKQNMPEAELVEIPVTGHAIQIQQAERFNALLESAFQQGRERVLKKQT